MINKKERFYTEKNGMLLGLAIPALIILGYYLYLHPGSFTVFVKQTFNFSIYNKFIGLAIIPNFLVYFYFRWKSKAKFAEGITIASLLYLTLIIILKYI